MAGRSAASYKNLLNALLPRGRAWSRDAGDLPKLMDGTSRELARVDGQGASLEDERDSRTTTQLLTEHEADLAIVPPAGATAEERRQAVRSALLAMGGQDKPYFIAVALGMGYVVTIDEFTPFWSGLGVSGDPCGDQEVIFVWRVNVGWDPTRSDPTAADLVEVFERMRPAHTYILWRIYGADFSTAFSILDFAALPLGDLAGDFSRRDYSDADFFVSHEGDFERIDFSDADFRLYK